MGPLYLQNLVMIVKLVRIFNISQKIGMKLDLYYCIQQHGTPDTGLGSNS